MREGGTIKNYVCKAEGGDTFRWDTSPLIGKLLEYHSNRCLRKTHGRIDKRQCKQQGGRGVTQGGI